MLAIDHDHKTGKIRGLLCTRCNTAIGLLNDNIDFLRRAIMYLNSSMPNEEDATYPIADVNNVELGEEYGDEEVPDSFDVDG